MLSGGPVSGDHYSKSGMADFMEVEANRCLDASTPIYAMGRSVNERRPGQAPAPAVIVAKRSLTQIIVNLVLDEGRGVPGDIKGDRPGRVPIGHIVQLLDDQRPERTVQIFARPTKIIRKCFDRQRSEQLITEHSRPTLLQKSPAVDQNTSTE